MTPKLAAIFVYPIKSLDGVSLESANLLPSGALEYDRRWMMVDTDGRVVNGKRTPAVHRVEARFDLERQRVWLGRRGGDPSQSFHLVEERPLVDRKLSGLLGEEITLVEDTSTGFPDDGDAPGPTLITTETLRVVASWFGGLSLNQVRGRFRANLEIDGFEAFWEDRLVGEPDHEVPFAIGSVRLSGVNPCQRCVVPTRHPETGDSISAFARIFAERRRQSLPEFAPLARFDHFYRLAVNTRRRPPLVLARVEVGQELRIE